MLSAAALRATGYYGGFDGSPYVLGSQRLLLAAEKENKSCFVPASALA